ncbi:MAG: LysR family transcriptional regulator [Chloroflexota bacterium]|nr:MAG: LysR family transcriptional regulator [Chloroflexota bacterium]
MEIHQPEYLMAIFGTGGFIQAAMGKATYHYQNQQIRKFENGIRQPLLDWLGRKVKSPDTGNLLFGSFRKIPGELQGKEVALLL